MRSELNKDRDGKNEQERFEAIRNFFLGSLESYGNPRTELYYRPKPGDAREPTEEDAKTNIYFNFYGGLTGTVSTTYR